MANARSRFDTISSYLIRAHDVSGSLLFGKPALSIDGNAFAAFYRESLVLRLHGRVLAQALALAGSRGWDPLHPERPSPGWVLLPASHLMRWDRMALEALRCAKEAGAKPVSYALPKAPPPVAAAARSTTQSLAARFAAAFSAGMSRFSLAPADK